MTFLFFRPYCLTNTANQVKLINTCAQMRRQPLMYTFNLSYMSQLYRRITVSIQL